MAHLVIVGAGAKAAAIAAKVSVLRGRVGYKVPKLTVLEKHDEVAPNWRGGTYGYTDGIQSLGTPPDKDVGFPYKFGESGFPVEVAQDLFRDFSWRAYQAFELRQYHDWLDRNSPPPSHRDWANYLAWVFSKSGVVPVRGELTSLEERSKKWGVYYQAQGKTHTIDDVDGVVITGPGPAKNDHVTFPSGTNRIFDGATFWTAPTTFQDVVEKVAPIIVIGSGETAASIVVKLIELTNGKQVAIHVVNRSGTIFSRGEGYFENRMFTNPELWDGVDPKVRGEIVVRGDRGVISPAAHDQISRCSRVAHVSCDVASIEMQTIPGGPSHATLPHAISTDGKRTLPAQYIVLATGFDPWWFAAKITPGQVLMNKGVRDLVTSQIRPDLSISSEFSPAPIHVPMLAGIARGAGFPNLSCLGTLADRVLKPYVSPP